MISFGIAWGVLGMYIFLPELMETVFGQLTGNHPLFFLAVYVPAIAAFILAAIKGPVEEFGWRGLALPLLQRKFAPVWAGLILGSISRS